MRTTILAVCLLAAGCGDAGRVRDLERQVEKQEAQIRAQQNEILVLRKKLNDLELVNSVSRHEAVSSKNQLLIAQAGGTAGAPQSVPGTATAAPPVPPKPQPGGPSAADVARASDFRSSPQVIERHCTVEVGPNRNNYDECVNHQSEAATTLAQSQPAGGNERVWAENRVRCARDNPEDYVARLRCEQRSFR
jgi:hypothetical protein